MASLLDLNSGASDSEDDCDYVPQAGEISDVSDNDDISGDEVESRKSKKTKIKKQNDDASEDSDHEQGVGKELTAEEEKQRADNLWQSFMKDVPQKPKATGNNLTSSGEQNSTIISLTEPQSSKVTVTEVYEYAGEKVTVTKEVDSQLVEPQTSTKTTLDEPSSVTKAPIPGGIQKRSAKGLSSVLGSLSKKQKLSTLQKTTLDWKKFKHDEGIEEELDHHNKGKEGFLEKQAFLQRSDVRQFEIEKNLRLSRRTKF